MRPFRSKTWWKCWIVTEPLNPNSTAILSLIQDMVRQGESEESIVRTLTNLGVDAEKARRLLLLGQADTFALVQGEISKMVKAELEKQLPVIVVELRRESKDQLVLDRSSLENELREKFHSITDLEHLQAEVAQKLSLAVGAANRAEAQGMSLGKQFSDVRRDLEELKTREGAGSWKLLNRALLIVGGLLGLASAYLFYVQVLDTGLSVDAVLSTGLVALVAITMMIVSSLAV